MNYPSIRIEGAILSPDIFDRLDDAVGQQPADFGLESSAKVKDEIARAWADAQDYWRIFQRKLESLKAESPATTETRNNWIVPLLGLLGYQLEYQARGTELNGKNYPLSHRVTNRGQTPVHIIGCREPAGLDRKPEKSALRMSSHAMVQEYLNLTDQLFGLATNGRVLRLLRDSSRLIKLSYLEFDLDRIFADGLFADFAMLYRLLHASRLPQSAEAASSCWLERYHQDTIEQGTRIRDGLRAAVTEALELLGTGFISDPHNDALRQQIETKQLAPEDFFKHILRLVYRLLFLMVTEERGLVFPKGTPTKHINIYFQHYSVQRLRRLALTRGLKIERCHDAWLSLLSTFRLFEHPDTAAKLSMTALVGQLFHPESLGSLPGCRLSNAALFSALDRLCNFNHPKSGQRMPVNFGALATEEFGSVYESLLELHPIVEAQPTPLFRFKQAAGNERKTTGSYYTPSSLVDCLLDSALDPVLDERIRDFAKLGYKSAEAAILALKVCDPACGSGHFLIAAAQRIARRLARVRSGDDEPSPQVMRHALRDVIGHCIYGVDINPMSVELCKVALWMEAMEPGKPLSFLDHHIQCGNSLLGTTPALLAKGIPDDAFTAIEGDVKARVTELKKQSKSERPLESGKRQRLLGEVPFKLGNIAADFARLNTAPDGTFAEVAAMQEQYARLVSSSEYASTRLLADTWCAAFVWKKDDSDLGKMCPTERDFRKVESHAGAGLLPHVRAEVERLRDQYQFFHWHLAFPDVFRLPGKDETPDNEQIGWNGGFDVMLGNPPWERVKLQEKEWFAERRTDIATASNAGVRKRLIKALREEDPSLNSQFLEALRRAEGESHVMRHSSLYPLCARGDINVFAIFAECLRNKLGTRGRGGCIVQSDIATSDTCKLFFDDIVAKHNLVSFFDFVNTEGLFPAIHRTHPHFCLLTLDARTLQIPAEFSFWNTNASHLDEVERRFALTSQDITLLNPSTRTCPIFRSQFDAELTKSIYRKATTLVGHDGKTAFFPKIDMSDEVDLFLRADDRRSAHQTVPFQQDEKLFVKLYESKLIWQFDHRFGTFEGCSKQDHEDGNNRNPTTDDKADPLRFAHPRYFVPQALVDDRYSVSRNPRTYLLAVRRLTNTTNERTAVFCLVPYSGCGNSMFAFDLATRDHAIWLLSCGNSFALDYVARNKLGGTNFLQYIIEQLAFVPFDALQKPQFNSEGTFLRNWLLPRVLELTYTAWDMEPFARDCGYAGPPFRWDEERRCLLRAELDAAFFHLYGLNRDDTAYILDTFPIVRRKDIAQHGEYRTQRVILEIYDALTESTRTGQPYQTRLDPPPADPRVAHPPREAT